MASKRETKKKIKSEYQKLQEDILNSMSVTAGVDLTKENDLLNKSKESQGKFVDELNHTEDKSNTFFNDLLKRVVDDIDNHYKSLKDLITKK